MSRRYRLARLPAVALSIAIPVGGVMLVMLADVPIRRDLGLLVAVATVLALAWAGGIWPGLISTLLLVVLFAGPVGVDQFAPALDGLSIFVFAVAGLMGTGVVESLYRAQWGVEAARDRARGSRRAEATVRTELESIVAAIGDGILVAEADGSISLMNQAAVDLLGRRIGTVDDLLGEFVPSENGTGPSELDGSNPVTAEFELLAGNRLMELSSFPLVSEDDPARHVLVLRDVTVARRQELLREAFLSVLSHELRTPMTAVYAGAILLQRVGDKLDAASRYDLRADIVFEAERLSHLIEDLLVLAHLDADVEIGQEPALLQHIVVQVINRDYPGQLGKTILFVADPGLPPVRGDETSIQRVAHNLIANAVKYSPGSSDVEVQVVAGDDEVLVRVLDRGGGLSLTDAAHVFEPFYRGSATERMASGVGIGLFICQRLVEAMGGRLWTKPREGTGSEFGFALPSWPIEEEADEVSSAVGTGSSS